MAITLIQLFRKNSSCKVPTGLCAYNVGSQFDIFRMALIDLVLLQLQMRNVRRNSSLVGAQLVQKETNHRPMRFFAPVSIRFQGAALYNHAWQQRFRDGHWPPCPCTDRLHCPDPQGCAHDRAHVFKRLAWLRLKLERERSAENGAVGKSTGGEPGLEPKS